MWGLTILVNHKDTLPLQASRHTIRLLMALESRPYDFGTNQPRDDQLRNHAPAFPARSSAGILLPRNPAPIARSSVLPFRNALKIANSSFSSRRKYTVFSRGGIAK